MVRGMPSLAASAAAAAMGSLLSWSGKLPSSPAMSSPTTPQRVSLLCCRYLQAWSNNCYRGAKTSPVVVLGSKALFTKVGQLHVQMIVKRGGEISYLYRQNKGREIRASGRIRTYNLQHGPVFLEKKKTAETTQPQTII